MAEQVFYRDTRVARSCSESSSPFTALAQTFLLLRCLLAERHYRTR